MNVTYKVKNTQYNVSVTKSTNSQNEYKQNDTIDIYYDKNNPEDIVASVFPFKIIGIVLLVLAPVMVGGAFLHKHLVTKYKAYAVATGTANIVGSFMPRKRK